MEKIRTNITIETTETLVIKRTRYAIRGWCENCGREVTMLTPQESARLLFCDLSAIYSSIEFNHFHVFYMNEVKPYICMNSLCFEYIK